ncbi:MAG: putative metal-binding motif-containing protein [Deltaproteobacteria bacterium]|nr:putative metal-binding motif-containing protein [Deltaproteobacteria bacterium]
MFLTFLMFPSAFAQEILYQGDVQGGISVDGSGVATNTGSTTSWLSGPDIQVQIPATATITEVYAVVTPKASGFLTNINSVVRINGVDLSSATLLTGTTYYRSYQLDPATYGITGPGAVTYEERGDSDNGPNSGQGVSGTTLAVVYEDTTLPGSRHVVFAAYNYLFNTNLTISGLPTTTATSDMVLSVGIGWETQGEQDGTVKVNGTTIGTNVGGRDDSDTPSSGSDWNSLFTVGSFGFEDGDLLVGIDGDEPDSEPTGASSSNSRYSDELWRVSYNGSGSIILLYSTSTPDSWISHYTVVVELDDDADGVPESEDNCPGVDNPDQADVDSDGVGDDCDVCTDVDGDSYGDGAYAASTCAEDCDDGDSAINPGAAEIWYDGVDSDCDGESDYDADGDGDDASAYGGDDCDDGDAAINMGASEIWYDGVDQDCDGGSDFDADADGYEASAYGGDDCDDTNDTVYPGGDRAERRPRQRLRRRERDHRHRRRRRHRRDRAGHRHRPRERRHRRRQPGRRRRADRGHRPAGRRHR